MPKLRVDIYNPHPNSSALMAAGAAGPDLSSFTGGLIPGAIMGDNLNAGQPMPLADWLMGTDGDDRIYGGLLDDTLNGGAGNDLLDGGGHNDLIVGGSGNDSLSGGGNQGMYGDDGDDLLIGSPADNPLMFGGAGNDSLKGLEGRDQLWGDAGDDLLIGGAGDDVLLGGAGHDRAEYLTVKASVKIDLNRKGHQYTGEGWDKLVSIEFLSSGEGNDTLIGSSANNTLIGWLGNDTLYGRAGSDALWGFAGKDKFVFDAKLNKKKNIDWLYDFNRKEKDKIVLDNDIFKGLKAGKLKKSAFHIGSKAKDAEDRILYNKAVKALAYDPDGNGPKAATMFAKFPGKESLTHSDFLVIG